MHNSTHSFSFLFFFLDSGTKAYQGGAGSVQQHESFRKVQMSLATNFDGFGCVDEALHSFVYILSNFAFVQISHQEGARSVCSRTDKSVFIPSPFSNHAHLLHFSFPPLPSQMYFFISFKTTKCCGLRACYVVSMCR